MNVHPLGINLSLEIEYDRYYCYHLQSVQLGGDQEKVDETFPHANRRGVFSDKSGNYTPKVKIYFFKCNCLYNAKSIHTAPTQNRVQKII